MIRDLIIIVFSTLNILIMGFLGVNGQAVEKTLSYVEKTLSYEEERIPVSSKRVNSPHLLSIPTVNIEAPLHFFKKIAPEEMQEALQKGVVGVTPFALPREKKQTILFGHSSDYAWNKNPFAAVFSLLPKLQAGDLIELHGKDQTFSYRVETTAITDDQLSGIVDPSPSRNELILVTCYPIGFQSKRLAVIASPNF